ncbi:MAG TPA: helix-turn-helix transcriptional regulator [Thermoanaerobaculia bacterium]|jgi:transcriptional regulator with XRE-family HTH domain|nr:helix-turn-helix transcriptional regulator [Thermoanaerobaculia bacterium]
MASHLRPFRDLGPAVRLLRETAAALEQAQVAERTGIAQNPYENEKQLPDLPTLDQLLACYGVDMEQLDPQFTAKVKLGYIKPEEPD